MLEFLKKSLGFSDYLILAIAIFMFGFQIDFANMDWIQIIYAVSFGLWLVLLLVRLRIKYQNEVHK